MAGHEDLQTTLGYLHLAKGETERAIRLLDDPRGENGGNSLATEQAVERNPAT